MPNSPQWRFIRHNEDRRVSALATFVNSLLAESVEPHENWGNVKDGLHELNKDRRDPFLIFFLSYPPAYFQTLFIQVLEKRRGQ